MVLVRNDNWDPDTDKYRPAYPDKIVVKFGLDSSVIDQRLIQDAGADKYAATIGDVVQPANLATVFGSPQFADRRVDGYDPYTRYLAINVGEGPEPGPAQGSRGRPRPGPAAHHRRWQVRRHAGRRRRQAEPAVRLRALGHVDRSARSGDPGHR